MADARDFYNDLASSYDAMTSFDTRIESERRLLEPFVRKYGVRKAADMGCGSGVHALALSGLGVEVRGVDLSPPMLAHAREHALRLGLEAEFREGDMRSSMPFDAGECDAVFCLGNTVPHLDDTDDLAMALTSWRGMLREGGLLLVQTVNYDRVLSRRERILGVRMLEDGCIVRFYDFTAPRIGFNVLRIFHADGKTAQQLMSTGLRPFLRDELVSAAERAEFRRIEAYAALDGTQWSPDSAAVLITALR
jgi:SAM-dependent methyltransferase